MAEALAKPGTVTAVLSGKVGYDSATADFLIKVDKIRARHRVNWGETTGDGDATPVMDQGGLVYGTYYMRGWMVADAAIGIQYMGDSTKNPTSSALTINWSSSRASVSTVLVSDVDIVWDKTGPVIGVSMTLRVTSTTAANMDT